MKKATLGSRNWFRVLVALLLAAATVASRIPFASRMLYSWDSGNFALALNYFNVAFHQPHPPGYPLYVGAAKLIDLWVLDANSSYVAVGIAASAGAVAVLFLLASSMYGFGAGLASALILGASVGFWGYGEVAFPYTCLAFFGTLVAWLCYLIWQGHKSVAVLCGLALGIAGGFRQDLLVFLGPLWLLSVWRAGLPRFLLSTLVLGLVVASWMTATVQLSGGWDQFERFSNAQTAYIVNTYSVLAEGGASLRRNATVLLTYTKQVFGLSAIVLLYFLGRFLTFRSLVVDRRVAFILLWALPPTLVYLLLHIGDPGYVLSIVPVLCLITGAGLQDIADDARAGLVLLSGHHARLTPLAKVAGKAGALLSTLLLVGLVAWNANAFLKSPGPARWMEIQAIDGAEMIQVGYARSFAPDSLVVLGKDRYRQMKYYLPGYDVRLLYDEYQDGYMETRQSYKLPDGVKTVVVLDFGDEPKGLVGASGGEMLLTAADGRQETVWQFDVNGGDTIEYGYDYFAVKGRS